MVKTAIAIYFTVLEASRELLLLEKYSAETTHRAILELTLKTTPTVLAQIYVFMVNWLSCKVEVVKSSVATVLSIFKRSAV